MLTQSCDNCKFSFRESAIWLECRRYPPTSSQDVFETGFPVVRNHTVCGEWQPAQNPADLSKVENHGR